MATKRTYIGVDEELVVKGRLTIEGNVTQIESTQEVNRVESNVFVINADGDAGTSVLAIKSGSDFANLSYATANLISSATLEGNIYIPNGGNLTIDSGATLSGNTFSGNASGADALTSAVTINIGSDDSDIDSHSQTFINAGDTVDLNVDLTDRQATWGAGQPFGTAGSVPTFTVNRKGIITASANTTIDIHSGQVNDFTSSVRGNISITDAGGDGSLAYNSGSGVITYTGPNQAEANARIDAAPLNVRAHLSATDAGGDGSFAYNNGTGVFTYTGPSASEVRAHFSASNGVDYNSSTGAFEAVEGEIQHDSLDGFVANEHIDHSGVSLTAGTGLTGGGDITASRTFNVVGGTGITANADDIEIDTSVVTTLSGTQTISGDKTFTGTVDLSGATVPAFTVDGNLEVTGNINSLNYVDLQVQNSEIILNSNVTVGQDALIKNERGSTGNDTYLKWDEGTDRWQFSNDGSTDNNMLLFSDFSATDAGGDGSFSYSNGVYTYTGPSASETRAHFSAGTGLTFSGGAFSITNTAVSAGTYGTSNDVAQFTVNAQGQITGASDVAIDHDALQNFVANEHVDHTSVTLTAGNGLSGGGDISASRTFALDLNELTSAAVDVSADSIAIIDATDNSSKKETISDLVAAMAGSGLIATNGVLSQSGFTGTIETADVGATGIDILQGSETLGNGTIRYYIRSIDGGTYTTASESSNVITIDGNISAIRGAFSVTDSGGDGSLSYNNGTGVFTYTGPSASETRAHISGTGLIGYDSGTGVISTTADNYSSWGFTTDSAGTESVTSGETITISGGTGVDVIHSGNTITISQDIPVGDITAVTAGNGLVGGGTSGAVTVNAAGGYGITVNADDIELSNSDVRGLFSASGDISYNSSTGEFSFTNDAGDIEGVTAGVGLTGGGTSGTVSLSVGSGYGISTTATTVEVANSDIRGLFTGSSGVNYDNSTGGITADQSEIRGFFSAGGDLSYNSSTGEFSFTNDAGDISAVVAGTGLSGGGSSGSVTLDVSGLTVSELSAGMLQTSGESFSNDDTSIMTSAAIEDKILSYGYTTNTGDITEVVAGNGLSGGASSGSANINVGAGSYIVVNANDVAVDATTTNTASKVVARDGAGNVAATYFNGTATSAHYADLAEIYEADADYEPGTVLVIGGEKEVTVTDEAGSYKVIGVVSTDPAYLMNSQANGVPVALRGRVPCKVTGNVNKGDILIASDTPGYAMVGAMPHSLSPLQIIGRALETKTDAQPGIIEIVV